MVDQRLLLTLDSAIADEAQVRVVIRQQVHRMTDASDAEERAYLLGIWRVHFLRIS